MVIRSGLIDRRKTFSKEVFERVKTGSYFGKQRE